MACLGYDNVTVLESRSLSIIYNVSIDIYLTALMVSI